MSNVKVTGFRLRSNERAFYLGTDRISELAVVASFHDERPHE